MASKEAALSKLNRDDHIRIALDMQKTQNIILSDMKSKLSELLKIYNKLES